MSGGFLFVQGQGTTATPALNLSELKLHREQWPAQVTLKVQVRLSIISKGNEVGAIVSPAGATVDLLAVNDTSLEIGVVDARATVTPDQTDLAERLAAQSQKSTPPPPSPLVPPAPPAPSPAPTNSAASLPSSPPSPMPAPAPPSASPAPMFTGSPLVFDYAASPGGRITKAAYRFWSPPYNQPIRGIIVLTPGLNGDGRGMVASPEWQALAEKYRLALVGSCLQGGNYYEAKIGTGDALMEALKAFAGQSNHPEVSQAPLLLYGESAGGQFDYDFLLWKPEQVMAFVVNKGGYYDGAEPDSNTTAVPGLFFLGMTDQDFRIKAITGIWTEGRKKGALWALAPQPNSGHEFSKTAAVARVFFDAVLKNRLPDDGASSYDASAMKPMQESQGWVGDMTTHEIHDASNDSSVNYDASWFPDQTSATAWKTFVSD